MKTQNTPPLNIEKSLKVAVVHDWLFTRRGGEKVLQAILEVFPQAELFYLFGRPQKILNLDPSTQLHASFLNTLPFIERFYPFLLPFLPIAAESFDLSKFDLILSSSSCVAKGIIPPPQAIHITYIHSPMRYIWDQEHFYFPKKPSLFRPIEVLRRTMLNKLRMWDVTSSTRADAIIANSSFVARRCSLYYGKSAHIIPPPLDLDRFTKAYAQKSISRIKNQILLFGAWTPYKRMGEALDFLLHGGFSVIAAGQGEELKKKSHIYKNNKNVRFVIDPSDDAVISLYLQANVLLFPSIEDFGIVPMEAMALGLPVVAPNIGGTAETVLPGITGEHFDARQPFSRNNSLLLAIKRALNRDWNEQDARNMQAHVQQFSTDNFKKRYKDLVLKTVIETLGSHHET